MLEANGQVRLVLVLVSISILTSRVPAAERSRHGTPTIKSAKIKRDISVLNVGNGCSSIVLPLKL
jgi:hypothetical protein